MGTTSLWTCGLVVLVSAISDALRGRIPNLVSLGGLAVGLAIQTAAGAVSGGALGAVRGFAIALGSAVACALLPFLSWRRNEMGGGDVKLFAAIGALGGPILGFNVEAITFVLSLLVLTPYRLVRHGAVRVTARNARIALANVVRRCDAKSAYLETPKLPPVILAPTIGAAFVMTLVQRSLVL